ncbi:MAG: methionyl-tRNA formyltransferase [Candidatus Omnitrophica bacterium]|nr:methionyl-tRNA formyltransferase [Candidatus Omnitrophota bacterium]
MRIVFFGSSEFSVPVLKALLSSKHAVVQVISTPDQKQGRGQKVGASTVKSFALTQNLPIITPEKLSPANAVETVAKQAPDFLVVASYGKMIPASIFKIPKIAPLNVHPSLLPKYRGASPIQEAILEGDEKTGVSIAEVTKDLDAGDLLGQVETPISPNENAHELSGRLAELGGELLLEVIRQFENGTILKTPQDASKSSYAKKITSESGRISWMKSAREIHNQVRAYHSWPSAFTFFHNKRLKVIETRVVENDSGEKSAGEIKEIKKGESLWVQAGRGILALVRVQLEGKREMNAFDFAIGQRIQMGERFES